MRSDEPPIDIDVLDAPRHSAAPQRRALAAPNVDDADAGAGDADTGADGEWIADFLPGLVNR
jgi:hypothetical protein